MKKQQEVIPERLTDEQIERLIVAINELKKRNHTLASVTSLALIKVEGMENKRRVIVKAFAECYSLLLVMDMAVKSDVTPQDFANSLSDKIDP